MTSRPRDGSTAPTTAADRRYRPELQGLRALASALVVIYHVWFHRVSGGVDVFFVISGFLLTGQLVRAAERGPLGLRARWSRTLLRLLPAATVVLVATVIAGAMILPPNRWAQTVREVVASALFVENWQLAADSVDYSARSNMASVVQHFWSLSIQGQFFVLWPLLIAVVAISLRGVTAGLRSRVTLVLGGVFALSLIYSIALTAENQPLAYFHTVTRLWEFALGGLIALLADRITLPVRAAVAAGWAGVVGLVLCGLVLQVETVFPGYAALWPTGCATLVLLAGRTGSRFGVDRLLVTRPARWLGDISYPLYLWHWPVLVLYLVASDRVNAGPLSGAAVIALSVALAAATHLLVEKPLLHREISTPHGYRLAVAGLTLVVAMAGGWQFVATQMATPVGQVGDAAHPGALALSSGPVAAAPVLPPPVSVYDDWVHTEGWDCTPLARVGTDSCTQPVTFVPTKRIVLVGDSHMQQFTASLLAVAQRNQWQLTTILRGACPFSTASEVDPGDQGCRDWNTAAAAEITEMHPDAVVTLASRDVRTGQTEQTPTGFVQQWQRLDALGIPVIAIRDNPRFDYSVPDCLAQHAAQPDSCGVARDAVYAADPPYRHVPDVPDNVTFVDIADAVCGPTFCPAEIGNVLVYLDDNHLSASYAGSMGRFVGQQVLAALR
ncbi:acyltransferase family protein [Pseudonocardia sp. GCM10023141]|uniref:acyltransferase family protein n=1 Tax=Pseudonocardia sp. GCM10023141 TaxID=3252653 RepID=UPI0036071BD6